MSPTPSPIYAESRVALLTRHGKEGVIAPVLDAALGCRVERVTGYDTDLLDTFTRDIPRAGMQLEAARKKARIGMELSGLPLGLASEGSFGPDPMAGMFPWNVEFLIFLDDERGLEVVGIAQGKAIFSHLLTDDWAAVEAYARQAGFPAHHLVVRPEGIKPLDKLFFDLFKGVLALFLLEMSRMADLRAYGALPGRLRHRHAAVLRRAGHAAGLDAGPVGGRHLSVGYAVCQCLLHRRAGGHAHRRAGSQPCPVDRRLPRCDLSVQHLPRHPDILLDGQFHSLNRSLKTMSAQPMNLLTIVSETVLEDTLVDEIMQLGATSPMPAAAAHTGCARANGARGATSSSKWWAMPTFVPASSPACTPPMKRITDC